MTQATIEMHTANYTMYAWKQLHTSKSSRV